MSAANKLQGLGVSPGVAAGRVLIFRSQHSALTQTAASSPEQEWQRFRSALVSIQGELQAIREAASKNLGSAQAAILDAHLMILEDPEIEDTVRASIHDQSWSAEYAVSEAFGTFEKMFAAMEDPLFRERAADVRDMKGRLIGQLTGRKAPDLSKLDHECLLVADDLPPSASAVLDPRKVLGIIAEQGGATSHMAILARSLGIPAVTGVSELLSRLRDGDLLAMSGETGEIEINPDDATLAQLRAAVAKQEEKKRSLQFWKGKSSCTADGHELPLLANIGNLKGLEAAIANDAEGIGLFRTEFLFMERQTPPSEDEQYEVYRKVLEGMAGNKTVIRTLDVGGDKSLPFLPIAREDNPFLGLRAIRYFLKDPALLRTQLRALLRASVHGKLGIMIPMITTPDEVVATRALLRECEQELTARGLAFAPDYELGIMIEVPAAAIAADLFVPHCDFFSIGTNDLIQYTCAVDRMNASVHALYDSHSPAVLRLIRNVIECAARGKIPVSICGEMGGMKEMLPILVGLGITQLSMNPTRLLEAREELSHLKMTECRELADQSLRGEKND